MARFAPHQRHSSRYYEAILRIILNGLNAGKKLVDIALDLQQSPYPSPTGNPWTRPALNGVMSRLRAGSGHFANALLQAHMDGIFSTAEARTLFRRIV